MPSIGHVAVGLATARIEKRPRAMGMHAWRGILILLSLLDTLTDGGLGVALLWPWSNHRFFAPWRPIRVAPIGAALFSARGLEVMLAEAVLFLPLFIVGLWPRRAD